MAATAEITDNGIGNKYSHADGLGSIVALTDENGTVKTRYSYSPFGETEVTGEASDNPFQYTGRENDGPTGLQLNRMRYYSYRLKRFISEDPIGMLGGVNFYSYTGNSPVNYTDPLGLFEGRAEITADPGFIQNVKNEFYTDYYLWRYDDSPNARVDIGMEYLGYATVVLSGAACTSEAAPGSLFAKGSGLLNTNRYLRIVWGTHKGRNVFRISGKWVEKFIKSGHIDIWKGSQL